MSSLRLLNKQQQGFLAMNSPDLSALTVVRNEVDVLAALLPLQQRAAQGQAMTMIELGCGNARLARDLLRQGLVSQVTGLEVDERQHAKNLAQPQDGLAFLQASAAAVPCADASFDLALMLKSLHHVPLPDMAQALNEVARVLRPGGWLYVSEPVYEGALNEVVKLFNDEGVVRAAAQAALDAALAQPGSPWTQVATHRFDTPVHYASVAEFEQRMLYPTFADHGINAATLQAVRAALEPHFTADGADFTRPMLIRLLQKTR